MPLTDRYYERLADGTRIENFLRAVSLHTSYPPSGANEFDPAVQGGYARLSVGGRSGWTLSSFRLLLKDDHDFAAATREWSVGAVAICSGTVRAADDQVAYSLLDPALRVASGVRLRVPSGSTFDFPQAAWRTLREEGGKEDGRTTLGILNRLMAVGGIFALPAGEQLAAWEWTDQLFRGDMSTPRSGATEYHPALGLHTANPFTLSTFDRTTELAALGTYQRVKLRDCGFTDSKVGRFVRRFRTGSARTGQRFGTIARASVTQAPTHWALYNRAQAFSPAPTPLAAGRLAAPVPALPADGGYYAVAPDTDWDWDFDPD